ncbi:hypothetical protein D3C85_1119300 [compost metagenome]
MGHPRSARRCQTVNIGPADHHRAGAKSQGLEHIGATTHTAVQQHRHLALHRPDHRRQHIQGGRQAVQGAASVVGNHYASHALPHRPRRIQGVHHALDQHRQAGE